MHHYLYGVKLGEMEEGEEVREVRELNMAKTC
jgi:hypothetical protein